MGTYDKVLRILSISRRIADYPNRIAGALLVGLVIAIMINALVLQQSRHPAPLFGKNIALPVSTPPMPAPRPQAAVALTPASVTPTQLIADPIGDFPQSPGVGRQRPAKTDGGAEARDPVRDPISQLLKSDAVPIPVPQEPSKIVLAAQRALVKLGFVLKPDGLEGGATRQAIEQYERDHHLPIHGELSAKLRHQLSAESGIAIE